MTDRLLTESPWNALFDNLPGIAQQVNQAMMQRRQQQLDQLNIDRQLGMEQDRIDLQRDQFDEQKEREDKLFRLNTYKALSEGVTPDVKATLAANFFENDPAVAAMREIGAEYSDLETDILATNNIDELARFREDKRMTPELLARLNFKIANRQRIESKSLLMAQTEGMAPEAARAVKSYIAHGDFTRAQATIDTATMTPEEQLKYWTGISEEHPLFPHAQKQIEKIAKQAGLEMPESKRTAAQWAIAIATGEAVLGDVPEELRETVSDITKAGPEKAGWDWSGWVTKGGLRGYRGRQAKAKAKAEARKRK